MISFHISSLPAAGRNFPQELVRMIISYLVYDTRTLLACSMTCSSWYHAALPHLHSSLTITHSGSIRAPKEDKYHWPKSLERTCELGLLQVVKKLHIRSSVGLSSKQLNNSTLPYFSALKNLQVLQIEKLALPHFMSDFQKYFGHFALNLRSLILKGSTGSCRQLMCFIGLFPKLRDLSLSSPHLIEGSVEDSSLILRSVPPLSGRLTMHIITCHQGALINEMINAFGGLRFRCMKLSLVDSGLCTWLLLKACAKTLETLQLPNPHASLSIWPPRFHLSQNRSLRTLETNAGSISDPTASSLLKDVLSTITSPLLLDLVIVYGKTEAVPPVLNAKKGQLVSGGSSREGFDHAGRFQILREMYRVRPFRLVLIAEVIGYGERYTASDVGYAEKCAVDALNCVVEEEGKSGGFDCFPQRPLVFSRICWP